MTRGDGALSNMLREKNAFVASTARGTFHIAIF